MIEETKKQTEQRQDNKEEQKKTSPSTEKEQTHFQAKKIDEKTEVETKKEEKKSNERPLEKKYEAIAKGINLPLSKKQSMYICKFIKNKNIEKAILDLELVAKLKKAVPFKGEIPHRKGKIMSGRYPQKAAKLFIKLLKGLRGNILQNNLDLDRTRISIASASWASRPLRSGNRQGKRTNVLIRSKEIGGT